MQDLILRICAYSPAIFLGLLMLPEPAKCLSLLKGLQTGVQNFKDHLTQQPGLHVTPHIGIDIDSRSAQLFVRTTGTTLILFGLLAIALLTH